MTTKVRASTLDLAGTGTGSGVVGISGGPRYSITASTTIDLTGLNGTTQNLMINGVGSITGFQAINGSTFFVVFAGIMTLVNSSSLITNKNASIVTAIGDSCIIRATGDNVVEIILYSRIASV